MNDIFPNLVTLLAISIGISLVPLIVVTLTAFLKISIVMSLVRNALGTQQTPSTIALYGIGLVLALYISAPLIGTLYTRLSDPTLDFHSIAGLQHAAQQVSQPLHDYLVRLTPLHERQFFLAATKQVWPPAASQTVTTDDFIILLPSFVASELTRGFEIGFLLYLPFLAIDLIVSNVLMAMGMTMLSPPVISTPFKIFLFVLTDGWSRLLHGLILSYS
jgi:type III secretion protein R